MEAWAVITSMINISERFKELIEKSKTSLVNENALCEAIYFQKPYILIGINYPNLKRRIYIDITAENWNAEQLKSFPRWRGLEITQEPFEQLGRLKNKMFLVISQDVEDSEEIFERVLQNMVDHIISNEELPLYTMLYEVLDRWHNFFKKKYDYKLTIEEEMGLYGELYYINRWMEIFPKEPPLIIKEWKGPLKNRIDFIKNNNGIEIKTISPKIRDEIKISNEKQLEINSVTQTLYIYVLKMEISESAGKTLQDLIEEIEQKLISGAPSMAVKFRDLLTEVGVVNEDYNINHFYVHEELAYDASDDFPKITSKQLPIGVTNVSYSVDLSHCINYQVPIENVFKMELIEGV